MPPFLSLTAVWNDSDLLELEATASNDAFSGKCRFYVAHGSLADLASQLDGFPARVADERTLLVGAPDANTASGSARVRFVASPRTALAQVIVSLEAAIRDELVQATTLAFPVEAAAVDSFVAALRSVSAASAGTATLRGAV